MKKFTLLILLAAACFSAAAHDGLPPASSYGEGKTPSLQNPNSSPQANRNLLEYSISPAELAQSYSLVRVSVDVGYAHMLGAIPENFYKSSSNFSVRAGFTVGADVCLMLNRALGLGAKVNFRHVNNETKERGKMRSRYWFVGPEVIYRVSDNMNRNRGVFGISLGYAHANQSVTGTKIHLGAFGAVFDLGYEMQLSDKTALLVKLSMITSSAKIGSTSIHSQYSREGLSSFNLTVGLAFGR